MDAPPIRSAWAHPLTAPDTQCTPLLDTRALRIGSTLPHVSNRRPALLCMEHHSQWTLRPSYSRCATESPHPSLLQFHVSVKAASLIPCNQSKGFRNRSPTLTLASFHTTILSAEQKGVCFMSLSYHYEKERPPYVGW